MDWRGVTAIHKAGHALMHILLGGEVDYVEVTNDPNNPGNMEPKHNFSDVEISPKAYIEDTMVAVAGEVALEIFKVKRKDLRELDVLQDLADSLHFAEDRISLDKPDDYPEYEDIKKVEDETYKQALAILGTPENVAKIRRISAALLARGRLSGSDIINLLSGDAK